MSFFNIFNWFKSTPKIPDEKEKQRFYVLSKDEYDGLIERLRYVESVIHMIPTNSAIPEPPPLPPTITKKNNHINTPVKHELNTFQIELMSRLERVREKMGASHGFGIGEVEDIDFLEKSIMEFQ